MSYLVLARKSRPQRFAEVVGQEAVVRTLQNGLRQNRVPHALIFSGVRGTGKTTLARIMAKALNCEQGTDSEPCNACRSCTDIMAGSSVDLQEVDGASNRGIQEIRELKENIRFLPAGSRYKIIIIDEVHMLTTEAFNALLKTLEEPPEHVYFMFATTELHKVPVTILSRCQRYELKRISYNDLFGHFASLAAAEGVSIDQAALAMVVREAGGSVRDGLSLLDQVFSYCGDTVTAQDVVEVLGLVSHRVIAGIADALLAGNLGSALDQLDEVYSYGMDLKRFINELLSWFRGLVVCRVSSQPEQLLNLPAEELARLRETATGHSPESLSLMLNLLMDELERAVYSSRPRFAVEMAFIKAVQVDEVVPLTQLMGRLDALLSGVPPQVSQESRQSTESVAGKGTVENRPPARSGDPLIPQSEAASERKEKTLAPTSRKSRQPAHEQPPATSQPEVTFPETPTDDDKKKTVGTEKADSRDVRKHWGEFVKYVRERIVWMAASLQRASSARLEAGHLIINYDDSVDCRILQSKENLTLLTEFGMDFFQENLQVTFRVPNSSLCGADPESGAALQKERQALANDPLVLTALEVFNGQVGDIRVGPRFRKPLAGDGAKEEH